MKVRKAIKKIAALSLGASMMGATMMGALAADLSEYPGMFIKNGEFQGVIVVGKEALSTDTIGMTNIALGLQGAAKTCTQVCTGGGAVPVSVDDGVELGDKNLFYGSAITADQSLLDANDLDILADGTYEDSEGNNENDEDYEQSLTIGGNIFSYYQDDHLLPEAAPAVKLAEETVMYNYTLEFDNAIDHDGTSSDLTGTTIMIQGREYTITKAGFSSNILTKLTLQSGESSLWLTKGDEPLEKTINGKNHQIEVTGVNINENKCGLKVDGVSATVNEGSTKSIGGIDIGVLDVVAMHTAGGQLTSPDMCKITIGSDEIVLEDGQEVIVNGKTLSGINVGRANVEITGTAYKWDGFTIDFKPDDDVYLAEGDSYIDPVFNNFKIYFANLVTGSADKIVFKSSGSTAKVTIPNSDGKELEFDLKQSGTNIILGDGTDIDDKIYLEGETCSFTGTDITQCEGARFLFVKNNEEAHILEITDFDANNGEVSLKDLTYGKTLADRDATFAPNLTTVALGSGYGDIVFKTRIDNGTCDFTNCTTLVFQDITPGGSGSVFKTDQEAVVTLSKVATEVNFEVTEYNDGDVNPSTFDINATLNSDKDIIWTLYPDSYIKVNELPFDDSDDPDLITVTEKGSVIVQKQDSNSDVTEIDVTHYHDNVYAQVFVTPTGASATGGGSATPGCKESCTINPIPSTANKFDEEITNVGAQNLIAVGGPCANAVTAELMGNPKPCNEGFEAGKAIIKLVEKGDKIALIVAGGTGMDTQLASRILQNYDKYKLSGKEMVATTVNEQSLSVQTTTE
ncbi:MAG: hypothetical protein QXK37_01770 [Candidatus Woesearchaeota archaeon]